MIEGIEDFEGMDIVIGVNVGCSDTKVGESKGGDATVAVAVLLTSVDGRGEAVFDAVSFVAETSSSLVNVAVFASSSVVFTSIYVLFVSVALDVVAGGRAGLSGREPRSDDGRESVFSLPLFTAFASRSCSLELGLLRDEFREACMPSAGFHVVSFMTTHLAPRPASCPRLPSQAHPACLCHRQSSDLVFLGPLRRACHPGETAMCQ